MERIDINRYYQSEVRTIVIIMEKPKINFSTTRILASFQLTLARAAKPNFIWRVVIGSFLCLAVLIGVFAYVTYMWAKNGEPPPVSTKDQRDGFSAPELKSVIDLYHHKEETYRELLHTRPTAPVYWKIKGTVAASSSDTGNVLP